MATPTLLKGWVQTTFTRSHFCSATPFDSFSLPGKSYTVIVQALALTIAVTIP